MRYHYQHPNEWDEKYGKTVICNHPLYSMCTLYLRKGKGLAVIQQRLNLSDKSTYWTNIDPWLVDELYLHKGFKAYFDKYAAKKDADGLYPTVPVRKIMWALKMKPIKKERWETVFDHCPV